jgi:hypothetical protein
MRHRYLALSGALTGGLALLWLVPAPIAGQSAAAASLRTPWGSPDLQGIWNVTADVPLERPAEYADREFLTDEEMAALDAKKAESPGRNSRAEVGTTQDVGGAYNAVFNSVLRTGKRTSMIIDPKDGRIPPLTEAAEKTQAAGRGGGGGGGRTDEAPESRSSGERCLGTQLPAFGGGIFASSTTIRIVQSPKAVGIYQEDNHSGGAVRFIPVDGSPHLPSTVRRWLGDPRGRWEGDTLVIDITNFSDKTNFRGSNTNLHLIERYRRVDADTLVREYTIEDPTVWTRPWTVITEFGRDDDLKNRIFHSECHEGNFGMTGILAGGRALEKAAAGKR